MAETDEPQLQVAKFPRNASCAVTTSWDDNDDGNMGISRILESMGLKGTFYVDPGNPRAKWAMGDGLTQSQLQAIAAANEVGSHTWSHMNLRHCDLETLREELVASKRYIETATGCPVFGFAYPWGEHSPVAERLVRECGYLFARTVDEGHVGFPPSNRYAWGVSVHALAKPRLLSRKAHVYAKFLTGDWCRLASKLFEKARRTNGVWHLFGHAAEVLRDPVLKKQFLDVCQFVARRNDVWYATNGMLFLAQNAKSSVHITRSCHDSRFVFRIQVSLPRASLASNIPVPLRLVVPRGWANKFALEVTTTPGGKFQMGRLAQHVWIDIFNTEARIELEKE